MKALGLVIATGPARGDLAHVRGLADAARARGVAVRVFAMHDGVAALADGAGAVAALLEQGCEVIACATSADRVGLAIAALGGAAAGSQDDHAALCAWADRVVAFT